MIKGSVISYIKTGYALIQQPNDSRLNLRTQGIRCVPMPEKYADLFFFHFAPSF